MFRRSLIDIKQPQELYCSNDDCTDTIALLSKMHSVLDDEGLSMSQYYCMACLIEELARKIK